MSCIRSNNTKPELLLRRELFKNRLRYRIHYKIAGKPDIVFPGKKYAVFVHGCFWHGHTCIDGHIPKSNIPFWQNKIAVNKRRDKRNIKQLLGNGWRISTIWECEIEKNIYDVVSNIEKILNGKGK